jgi:hypothetical protein
LGDQNSGELNILAPDSFAGSVFHSSENCYIAVYQHKKNPLDGSHQPEESKIKVHLPIKSSWWMRADPDKVVKAEKAKKTLFRNIQ